ncbi:hypothetical protein H0H93_006016 [Arthromyces matolae]|nr:hypothetical protein H0H93_006016 [Arthromyces matolae]
MDSVGRLENSSLQSTQLIELPTPICLVGIQHDILCRTYVPIPAYIYDERRHDQPRHHTLMSSLNINDGVFITIEDPSVDNVHLQSFHGTIVALLDFPHYPTAKIYGLRSQTGVLRALVVPLVSFSQFWLDLEAVQSRHSIGSLASLQPRPTSTDIHSLHASASTIGDSCDYGHDDQFVWCKVCKQHPCERFKM